jgi:hypothetical protein
VRSVTSADVVLLHLQTSRCYICRHCVVIYVDIVLLHLQTLCCYTEVQYRHCTAMPVCRAVVREKHPALQWRTNSCFLFHDYAPTHQLVLVEEYVAKAM